MEFEIILIAVVVIAVFLFAKSKWDEKQQLIKIDRKNEKEWGNLLDEDYTRDKLDCIKEYYLESQGKHDVDDITWNDVDMDTIYMMLNHTYSSMGQDYLYSMLRKLQIDEAVLLERERLISFFQKDKTARNKLLTEFRFMGKVKGISLYKYISRANDIPKHSPIDSIFMVGLLVVSILLMVLSAFHIVPAIYGVVMFVCTIINNIIHYFNRKAQVEKYFQVFMYIIRMLNSAKELVKLEIPEIAQYISEMKEILVRFRGFERGSYLVFFDSKRGEGSFWDLSLDYVRMIFHVDLIKFDSMVKKVQERKEDIKKLYEIMGLLDATLAIASFRAFLGEDGYCLPEFVSDTKVTISLEAAYHPMIEEPVANSITASRPVLITGSNASGKSTFIKTVAISAILAQTIHTVPAKGYKGSFFQVASSMALRDDLQGNESYYIVEIKSLKRILELSEGEVPVLCFVDEVLRGTNTLERIAASAQILQSFSETASLCFAATHDLELTQILEKYYDNYHFQEEIIGDQVVFDYQLREGKAFTRNAIKLLGMMGYKKEMISKAEDLANEFLETGIWKQV